MSRSGYTDDCDDDNSGYLWMGAVNSAINGKRGQKFLRDLLAALDAKPEKTLVAHALVTEDGNHCALGVIGRLRGIDMPITNDDPDELDDDTTYWMAAKLDIAPALAREIVYLNDEGFYDVDTPDTRFKRVRLWVEGMIHVAAPRSADGGSK
jgi:hypothetical protein